MELRSFISGMLLFFAIENLLPFAGVRVSVSLANPLLSLVLGIGALIIIYVLQKHG
ncbi:MAG: hypothetical protein NTX79_08745 [Candidatus Micrarchaeota archaeon]|nr:hypothetical protein [Candidatus Micrarchaeota archaeon]